MKKYEHFRYEIKTKDPRVIDFLLDNCPTLIFELPCDKCENDENHKLSIMKPTVNNCLVQDLSFGNPNFSFYVDSLSENKEERKYMIYGLRYIYDHKYNNCDQFLTKQMLKEKIIKNLISIHFDIKPHEYVMRKYGNLIETIKDGYYWYRILDDCEFRIDGGLTKIPLEIEHDDDEESYFINPVKGNLCESISKYTYHIQNKEIQKILEGIANRFLSG